MNPELRSAMDKLLRYGLARDRTTDREPRAVTLTDDEAAALVDLFDEHVELRDRIGDPVDDLG